MTVVLLNVKIVPLNVRENKTIRECDKSVVTCGVGAANVKIVPSNVRKK